MGGTYDVERINRVMLDYGVSVGDDYKYEIRSEKAIVEGGGVDV